MESVIEEIKRKYSDKVDIIEAKLDINNLEYNELASKYEIMYVPTLVFLNSEDEVFFTREGFYDEQNIVNVFDENGI